MTVELHMKFKGGKNRIEDLSDTEREDMERCLEEDLGIDKATIISYVSEMDVDK